MLLSGSAWAVSSQETVENGDAITAVPQQRRTVKGIVKMQWRTDYRSQRHCER